MPRITRQQPILVRLDSDWEMIAGMSDDDPLGSVTLENLAYVIYTSGSTGQPKGVQIAHRSLLNLVEWHRRAFAIDAHDRATQLAGLAFDATVWELWPYLAVGASIVMVAEELRAAPEQLRAWLLAHDVSIAFLPTPLAELVLALPWPATLRLRALLTGGDRLQQRPPDRLPFALVNNYGPTENTVVSTSGVVRPDRGAARAPDIGRPISNVQVYLLDPSVNLVPVGVWGELYIGGAGLARGYLARPDLTAERFVPNPFAEELGDETHTQSSVLSPQSSRGARLYRTGDLARYRPDGVIEFLGRNDTQVKVRGFRIELGEIETLLRRHPAVREGVVLARADAPGELRLVAYVVPSNDQRPPTNDQQADDSSVVAGHSSFVAELRDFLKRQLPASMVPSRVVLLDALPLTPNGKVDRAALPAPDDTSGATTTAFVAPRNAVEAELVALWTALLKRERVGIHDPFFDLGGHSLLATQLVSRVREAFHVDLSLHSLFAAPTVAQLAVVILQKQSEQLEQQLLEALLAELEQLSDDDTRTQLSTSTQAEEEHRL